VSAYQRRSQGISRLYGTRIISAQLRFEIAIPPPYPREAAAPVASTKMTATSRQRWVVVDDEGAR
jgi:hypothetical protein